MKEARYLNFKLLNLKLIKHYSKYQKFNFQKTRTSGTLFAGVPRRKFDNAVRAGRAARNYHNVTLVSHTPQLPHQREPGRNFPADETYHSSCQSGR